MEDSGAKKWLLGLVLLVVPFLSFALLIAAWPTRVPGTDTITGRWDWLNALLGTNPEIRLLVIVMIAGAVGSSIHAAKAFAFFVGSSKFGVSWLWWYVLRFPTGIGLALLMYLVIRGGLFAGSFADQKAAIDAVNPFGFAALAALTGMFSRQASDKLEEIFEGIFRTDKDGGEEASAPVIGLVPDVAVGATGAALEITVTGENFHEDAVGFVDDVERVTSVPNSTSAKVTLLPADVAAATTRSIRIDNPEGRGGKSEPADLRIV